MNKNFSNLKEFLKEKFLFVDFSTRKTLQTSEKSWKKFKGNFQHLGLKEFSFHQSSQIIPILSKGILQ